MSIQQAAIDRYLQTPPPTTPLFKGAEQAELYEQIERITRYRPTTKPWAHQVEGLAFALWARQLLLFYGMRLGKSRMALEWAVLLRKAGLWRQQGLIIAHAPIGLDVWEDQVRQYAPELRVAYVRNSLNEFLQAIDDNNDLIVTPWSGLQAMFSVKALSRKQRMKLYPDRIMLRDAAKLFDLCIMDEIHLCKDHTSLRFQIAVELTAQCANRMGLTGTPIGRSAYGIWAQSFLVDRGKTLGYNYYFFERAFGHQVKHPFVGLQWKFDNKKLALLRRKLTPIALSYEMEEVRDVDVRAGIARVRMSDEQAEMYNDVINRIVEMSTEGEEGVKQKRAEFIRLRQVASGYFPFVDDNGNAHCIDFKQNAKIAWLDGMLDEWNGRSPIVIFHEFTHSGELICNALRARKLSHSWFYGGTKQPDKVLHEFQSGRHKIMVANTAKGGVGIDLSVADYLLFFESPVSPIVRKQAEARPLAASRGTRRLWMDDIVCAPVEERIRSFIREGREAMAALMSDRQALQRVALAEVRRRK